MHIGRAKLQLLEDIYLIKGRLCLLTLKAEFW